jgi:hypothetical protein
MGGQLTYGTTDTRMRDTPRAERVTATDDDDDVKRSSVYEDEDSGLIGTGQRQQRSYERQQQSYRRRTIGCWVVAALLLVSVGLNLFMAGGSGGSELSSQQQTSFSVSYTAAAAAASDESAAAALDGRVYLLLSSLAAPEPRFQVREVAATTVHIIGQDVDGMAAAKPVSITTTNGAQGYPARTLEDVAPGRYYAQAVLVTYETFHLATGQTVKLPSPDRGDGMHWTRAPGNLYSTPVEVTVTANGGEQEGQESYELVMDHVMPEIPNQGIGEDTEYVKHLRVVSPLLSAFWGREMWLGAIVLLRELSPLCPALALPCRAGHGHAGSGQRAHRIYTRLLAHCFAVLRGNPTQPTDSTSTQRHATPSLSTTATTPATSFCRRSRRRQTSTPIHAATSARARVTTSIRSGRSRATTLATSSFKSSTRPLTMMTHTLSIVPPWGRGGMRLCKSYSLRLRGSSVGSARAGRGACEQNASYGTR